jgi:hypothetical protein
MNASLHFKTESGAHRVLEGGYKEIKAMLESPDDISWSIKERSDYARSEVELCSGILPFSPVFICINGGKK